MWNAILSRLTGKRASRPTGPLALILVTLTAGALIAQVNYRPAATAEPPQAMAVLEPELEQSESTVAGLETHSRAPKADRLTGNQKRQVRA